MSLEGDPTFSNASTWIQTRGGYHQLGRARLQWVAAFVAGPTSLDVLGHSASVVGCFASKICIQNLRMSTLHEVGSLCIRHAVVLLPVLFANLMGKSCPLSSSLRKAFFQQRTEWHREGTGGLAGGWVAKFLDMEPSCST